MNIAELPFNKLIGLQLAEKESGFLVFLPNDLQYTNHLGTVHGGALMSVAEAGSGVFLLQQFGENDSFVPVVRKFEAKFRKPANGQVATRCMVSSEELKRWEHELSTRGRLSASVSTEVVDMAGNVVLSATIEWFIARSS